MEFFSAAQLSSSGTSIPLEGEFVLTNVGDAVILTHDKKPTTLTRGLLTVTTHRIIWINASRTKSSAAWVAHLPAQRPFEEKSSPFHTRILLNYGPGLRVEFHGPTPGKDRDRFCACIRDALRRKEWEVIARTKAAEAARKAQLAEYVPRRLGISAIQERVVQRRQQQQQTIDSSFASLDHLRSQAADLVKIAVAFKSASVAEGQENQELLELMSEMGIESPVTKESTGGNVRVYREQLSRQLAQFLQTPIINVGGVMTMVDAYCVVIRNRATTELVSPEDFRAACGYFQGLNLPVKLVRLESGVDALEIDTSADSRGAKVLRKLAEERGSVTPIDVTRIRHIPIQRSKIMLEDAEKRGLLARDETTEGLRFFPNMFESFNTVRAIESFNDV